MAILWNLFARCTINVPGIYFSINALPHLYLRHLPCPLMAPKWVFESKYQNTISSNSITRPWFFGQIFEIVKITYLSSRKRGIPGNAIWNLAQLSCKNHRCCSWLSIYFLWLGTLHDPPLSVLQKDTILLLWTIYGFPSVSIHQILH